MNCKITVLRLRDQVRKWSKWTKSDMSQVYKKLNGPLTKKIGLHSKLECGLGEQAIFIKTLELYWLVNTYLLQSKLEDDGPP